MFRGTGYENIKDQLEELFFKMHSCNFYIFDLFIKLQQVLVYNLAVKINK